MTPPQPSPDHDTDRDTDHTAGAGGAHGPAPASRHDSWAAPPPAGDDAGPAAAGRWRGEIAEGLAVAAAVAAVTGVALGLLWLWLAPRVPLVYDGEAVLLSNAEGEEAIGADGTFLLLGLGLGAVAGGVVFLLRRHGGVGVAAGLAAGALGGSLLAFRLGVWLGPGEDIAARAHQAGRGVVFDAPLDLGAHGVLFGLPFAALAVHLLCVAAWGPRDPEPRPAERPHWGG